MIKNSKRFIGSLVVLSSFLMSSCGFNDFFKHEHKAGDPVEENRVEPTCTEDGSYDLVTYCTEDGEEMSRQHVTIPALNHDLIYHEGKEVTCTEDGWAEYYTCSRCDYSTFLLIEAVGHIPGEPVEENFIDATCTEEGSYDLVVYCSEDGVELSRQHKTIPAKGHAIVHHSAKAATCTEVGWAEYDTCSRCNYSTYVEIPAKGHTPADSVIENRVEPTCTEEGHYDVVTYCSEDGAELSRETETIAAKGHTPGNPVEENRVEPTCTETGSYDSVVYCVEDNVELSRIKNEIPAKGHSDYMEVKKNIIPSTCTETGSYDLTTYCGVCGLKVSEQHIVTDALGHDLVHHHGKDSSCTEHGYDEYYECSRCDYSTKVLKDLLDHNLSEPKIENVVAPSEYQTGSYDSVIYCTVCGDELSRVNHEIGNCDKLQLTRNKATIFEKDYYRFFLNDDIVPVSWYSSNEELVSINSAGKIATFGPGEVVIVARDSEGHEASAYLTIKEDFIDFTIPSNKYYPNDSVSAVITSCSRENPEDISWSSDNTSVASVSNGRVTAVHEGQCTITATLPSGKSHSVLFSVTGYHISLNITSKTLYRGETIALTATLTKADSNITWTTSDSSIVSIYVNSSDKTKCSVTANGVGTATITVKSTLCGTATCKITVTKQTINITKSNYDIYVNYSYSTENNIWATGYGTFSVYLTARVLSQYAPYITNPIKITVRATITKSGYGSQSGSATLSMSAYGSSDSKNINLSNSGVSGWSYSVTVTSVSGTIVY